MSPIDIAIGLLVGLLAFWLLGGPLARLGSLMPVLTRAASLALDPRVGAAQLIAVGAAAWLAGHWHYASRHHS